MTTATTTTTTTATTASAADDEAVSPSLQRPAARTEIVSGLHQPRRPRQ